MAVKSEPIPKADQRELLEEKEKISIIIELRDPNLDVYRGRARFTNLLAANGDELEKYSLKYIKNLQLLCLLNAEQLNERKVRVDGHVYQFLVQVCSILQMNYAVELIRGLSSSPQDGQQHDVYYMADELFYITSAVIVFIKQSCVPDREFITLSTVAATYVGPCPGDYEVMNDNLRRLFILIRSQTRIMQLVVSEHTSTQQLIVLQLSHIEQQFKTYLRFVRTRKESENGMLVLNLNFPRADMAPCQSPMFIRRVYSHVKH